MRFASLYSGSSGNCTLIETDGTRVLIDLGVSCRRIVAGLAGFCLRPEDIDAVLITHEHTDHIAGLEVFLRRYRTPLFCTAETERYLRERNMLTPGQKVTLISEDSFPVGDLWITPFVTSHDSLSARGYRLECGGTAVALATDTGWMPEPVYELLRGCAGVALEANYDEFMLRHGPYPRDLQQRIASRKGHLSNDQCAEIAARLVNDGTRKILLMHLSAENNTPDTALTRVLGELENRGLEDCGAAILPAPRHEASCLWEV